MIACRHEFLQKRGAVALDDGVGVGLGESQVESITSVGLRESANARGKSMNEPGKFAQALSAESAELALLPNL